MMFVPDGGVAVPLKAVNWWWSGSASNSNPIIGWVLVNGTNSVNPTNFDVESFPSWESLATNYQWIPGL